MSDWVDVCEVDAIPCGTCKVIDIDDAPVAVFNLDGTLYAIEDVCTHDGGDLASGRIVGHEIECPRHGARFDIRNGQVTAPPAYEGVHVFPVRVHEGSIQVRDDRWD